MIKKQIITVLFFLLYFTISFSQQYFFKRFSIEEGLPQSSVYCLLQDSRDYIWMGTDGGGLSRFDGVKFESFTKTDGLSDNVIRCLFEDSNGNIWIGTDNGLTLYNGTDFTIIGSEQGLQGSIVLRILEGKNGIIWIGTNDGGLSGLTVTDTIKIINYTTADGLVSNFIYDIFEDDNNLLWLAMVGGLNVIEFTDNSSGEIKNITRPDMESNFILSIEPGKDGNVWLGTYGDGLFKAILSDNNKNININYPSVNHLLPGMVIWDIMCREDGEIWLATDKNGIIRLKDEIITGTFNRENGLHSNQILDIMTDNENNTWFASFGQGTIMFQNEKLLNYSQKEGLIGNQVFWILPDNGNKLYLGTEEGFLSFINENGKIRRVNYFSSKNGLNDQGANVIIKRNNQVLIGTNNGINIFDGTKILNFPQNNLLPDRKINCLLSDKNNILWIGTNGGYVRLSDKNFFSLSQEEGLIHDEVQTIIEDKKGRIWMGTLGGLVMLDGETYTDFNEEDGLLFLRINCLAEDNTGNIWIGTFGGGLFKFDITKNELPIASVATKGILSSGTVNTLLFINDSILIAGTDKGFDLIELNHDHAITGVINFGLNDGFTGGENNLNAISRDNAGMVWFGTRNGLMRFHPGIDTNFDIKPPTCITGLKLFFENVDWEEKGFEKIKWFNLPENLVLSHKENHITFEWTGFSFQNPEDLVFSYSLEPQSKEWAPYSADREQTFSGLNPGNYKFRLKAKNKYGTEGDITDFNFSIKPPFWQTTWFIVSSSLLIIVIVITAVRLRVRSLIREKIKLENIVQERTREVVEQKDEIAKQRDIVTFQKKEITDSIHYAETIQRAVLPEDVILNTYFNDYFILFRPKDIVSGDFYWMSRKNGHIVFTAADCTGHGVPGAFMSMLGVSFLNKIVNESGMLQPDAILNSLRQNIITALKQKGAFETSKDGMDIALCSVDTKTNKLYFSGANNPLYLFRKTGNEYEHIERKGDKMPVGFHSRMDNFTLHELDIQKGDTIYLFSDGFHDQFGGPEGKKFMKSRFIQMLQENQNLDMASQKEVFNKTLEEWIHYPSETFTPIGQIDDVILLGVRI